MKRHPVPTIRNLFELQQAFPTEESCHDLISRMRWGDTPVCVHCGSIRKIYKLKGGKLLKCADCRKPFTVRIGTIFEDSPLPLLKWFYAIFIVTAHKKGISSVQLAKDLSVTQKTAWFMLHRIRYMVRTQKTNKGKLSGIVETDETWIGGKQKGRNASHSRKLAWLKQTPVAGMVERDGRVIAQTVANIKGETIKQIIREHVEKDSRLMTDEYRGYHGLDEEYQRETVNHGEEEYVRGDVHTNTIEGFWSLLKRGIAGIYHQVSRKHLDRYIDEFEYRYNTRKAKDTERFKGVLTHLDGRLMYKTLIAK